MRSIGRLTVLSQELSLKYSPVVMSVLQCMQDSSVCQLACVALPRTNAAIDKAAETAEPSSSRSQPKTVLSSGPESEAEADLKDAKAAAAAAAAAAAEQGGKNSLLESHSAGANDAEAAATAPAAAPEQSDHDRHSVIANQTTGASDTQAATAASAAAQNDRNSLEHSQKTGDNDSSRTGFYADPGAEALLVEAVHVAAAMVEAFPHVHADLMEVLASGLKKAISEGKSACCDCACACACAVPKMHQSGRSKRLSRVYMSCQPGWRTFRKNSIQTVEATLSCRMGFAVPLSTSTVMRHESMCPCFASKHYCWSKLERQAETGAALVC